MSSSSNASSQVSPSTQRRIVATQSDGGRRFSSPLISNSARLIRTNSCPSFPVQSNISNPVVQRLRANSASACESNPLEGASSNYQASSKPSFLETSAIAEKQKKQLTKIKFYEDYLFRVLYPRLQSLQTTYIEIQAQLDGTAESESTALQRAIRDIQACQAEIQATDSIINEHRATLRELQGNKEPFKFIRHSKSADMQLAIESYKNYISHNKMPKLNRLQQRYSEISADLAKKADPKASEELQSIQQKIKECRKEIKKLNTKISVIEEKLDKIPAQELQPATPTLPIQSLQPRVKRLADGQPLRENAQAAQREQTASSEYDALSTASSAPSVSLSISEQVDSDIEHFDFTVVDLTSEGRDNQTARAPSQASQFSHSSNQSATNEDALSHKTESSHSNIFNASSEQSISEVIDKLTSDEQKLAVLDKKLTVLIEKLKPQIVQEHNHIENVIKPHRRERKLWHYLFYRQYRNTYTETKNAHKKALEEIQKEIRNTQQEIHQVQIEKDRIILTQKEKELSNKLETVQELENELKDIKPKSSKLRRFFVANERREYNKKANPLKEKIKQEKGDIKKLQREIKQLEKQQKAFNKKQKNK